MLSVLFLDLGDGLGKVTPHRPGSMDHDPLRRKSMPCESSRYKLRQFDWRAWPFELVVPMRCRCCIQVSDGETCCLLRCDST